MTKTLVLAVALWDYSLKSPPKTFEAETIFTDLFDTPTGTVKKIS